MLLLLPPVPRGNDRGKAVPTGWVVQTLDWFVSGCLHRYRSANNVLLLIWHSWLGRRAAGS